MSSNSQSFCARSLFTALALVLLSAVASQADEAGEIWKKISPFFTPPAEFAKDFGKYRSPLKFYDGRTVTTADQWKERRKEILDRWHEMMGQWPPIIENPKIEYLTSKKRDNFTQHQIQFDFAPERPVKAYLLVPEGDGPFPGVVTVYYEPETAVGLKGENRDFAYQLAKRGFVTLSVGHTYSLYYPSKEDAKIQPLSALAYGAANAYHVITSLKQVDPDRVGIVGHSYGGKWAMFAACLYDKFACSAWSDGGIVFDETHASVNYWTSWYLGYEKGKWSGWGKVGEKYPRTGLYKKLIAEGYDLHELHALMAPRPFLVSGGAVDRPRQWRALNHAVAVNRLLGHENRVAMTNRKLHSPNPESNELMYSFLEYFLKHDKIAGKGS